MAGLLSRHLVVFVFIFTFLVGFSASLMCYQCVDAGDDTDCQDAAQLLNVTMKKDEKDEGDSEERGVWKRNKYYKNCDNEKVNNTMCMIEVHSSNGAIKSYHRDCTDGKIFSFTGSAIKLPRLANLVPNNETTCSYYAVTNLHVCLQLCEGNMCNGPVFPKEPEVVCYNVTDEFGDNVTVCGASTLTNFVMHGTLNAIFFIYFSIIFLLV